MDPVVFKEVKQWLSTIPEEARIADLGSFRVNDAVRDIRPETTVGFDLQEGTGVDVVLKEGFIPEFYQGHFDVVTAISSYQFSPNPEAFKMEILKLLKLNGLLFLTTCANYCQLKHYTSEITQKVPLRRWFGKEIIDFFGPEISIPETKAVEWSGHVSWIFFGKRVK